VTPKADLSPLSDLPRLRELVIRGGRVERLAAALAASPSFTRLFLDGDRAVKDVRPLRKLVRLELLNLSETAVTDVSPLAELPNLQVLKIWNAPVRDIRVLARFPALRDVLLSPEVSDADRRWLREQRPGMYVN
jgi:hypothetical protein